MKTWKNKWIGLGASILCLTLSSGSLMASTEQADWLTTKGNEIVDQEGNKVWLTGLNWFGFNTETSTFDGIWAANLAEAMKGIADHGFNLMRIPVTSQLMEGWMTDTAPKPNVNTYVNPELEGMNSLELFDEAVRLCKENGIKIMLDIHSARSDGSRHFYPVWYEGETGIDDYHRTLEWFAERYKEEDTIVAIDLKNEPHGKPYHETLWAKWDNSTDDNNWKYAAEVVGNKILDINPNLLVVIEGVEAYPMEGYDYTTKDEYMKPHYYYNWWGGNLRGVKDYPVELGKHQAQIVYSPHDYGPTVYNQPWFQKDFTKESLYEDCWRDNWSYIMEENIAPLLIGEWGGFLDGGKNQKWLELLRDYIVENNIHHTFWCYNPNSGDTGGLVLYDFMTWDEEKYAFVETALWQDEAGKFISLDHDIPLGTNGISLSEYLGKTPPTPGNPDPAKQKGDINEDGEINSTDYALLERYTHKKVSLSIEGEKNADTNEDGHIDEVDLSALEKYILGDHSAF